MAEESEVYDDFCAEMHSKTKTVHDESDKLINTKLAVVLTDTRLYAEVLSDFYFVFQTLEKALEEHKDHPCVASIVSDDLLRTKAFEKDLEYYIGEDWNAVVEPSMPARTYCDRIVEVAEADPTLLLAYTHSMYLALLAGGMIIKKIVKRTLGLPGTEGLAVFDIAVVGKTGVRKEFKDRINNLDVSRELKDKIIEEKLRCYRMNNSLANNVKPNMHSYSRIMKLLLVCLFMVTMFLAIVAYSLYQVLSK